MVHYKRELRKVVHKVMKTCPLLRVQQIVIPYKGKSKAPIRLAVGRKYFQKLSN